MVSAVVIANNIICCDGKETGALHPAVYLKYDAEGKVVCPYCNSVFYKKNTKSTNTEGSVTQDSSQS